MGSFTKTSCRKCATWTACKKRPHLLGAAIGEEFSNERDVNGYTDASYENKGGMSILCFLLTNRMVQK